MTKAEIRKKYKDRRASLSHSEREKLSELIANNLKQHFDLSQKKISCFVPISRLWEINTWLIIDTIKAEFYLPKINTQDVLEHHLYEGKKNLKENDWGILEPTNNLICDSAELNVVLVPLLVIDKKGFRVGYGKGYYDRFLKNCSENCVFIGLSYFDPIEKIDDVHDSDIALHACITSEAIYRF